MQDRLDEVLSENMMPTSSDSVQLKVEEHLQAHIKYSQAATATPAR